MELDFLQKIFLWLKDRVSCDLIILNYKTILLVILSCFIVSFLFDKFITNKIYHSLAYIGYFFFIAYILFIAVFSPSLPKFLFFPEKLKDIWESSTQNINNKNEPNAKILDCKNIKQEKDLCTTASAEIVLKYYKDYNYDQKSIKALSENK
ncbi:MAG: hypothetical protein EBV19_09080, partial [Flavobacteriia bacterium]|nr:hypothetical protein [Flavobacteriia bacterium]